MSLVQLAASGYRAGARHTESLTRRSGVMEMRLCLALLLTLWAGSPAAGDIVGLDTVAVALDPGGAAEVDLGPLVFLGGLQLTSDDPRFGGWSAAAASSDLSRLLLVGDRGTVASLRLRRDPETGRLVAAEDLRLWPLLDRKGLPLAGQMQVDAESLVTLPSGAYAVGFEHDHRIDLYDSGLDGPAGRNIAPEALRSLPVALINSGVEALARRPQDGLIVAILEGPTAAGKTRAFLGGEGDWRERSYRLPDGFGVTDAAFLENGDLLVLERFYSRRTGPQARIRHIAADNLSGDGPLDGGVVAELARPLSVDNYEILLVGRDAEGPLLLIASDDNFNPLQRSLVMLFRLAL